MFRKNARVCIQREEQKYVLGRVVGVHGNGRYDVDYKSVNGTMVHRKMVKEEDLGLYSKSAYDIIFDRLEPIVTALGDEDHVKLESKGFMDLHVNKLGDDKGAIRISLAHYYEQNGDMIPDPDMEIRVYPNLWQAEALTFQNCMVYQEVYTTDENGRKLVYRKLKKDLNHFLKFWLSNIKKQGFLKGDTK